MQGDVNVFKLTNAEHLYSIHTVFIGSDTRSVGGTYVYDELLVIVCDRMLCYHWVFEIAYIHAAW